MSPAMIPTAPGDARSIGLALGGGAARGWAHIGVIEVLEEAGIALDAVSGTSIGSLVGAAWVCGCLPALRRFALDLDRRAMAGLVDVQLTRGGLLDGRRIVAVLKKVGIDRPIAGAGRPFAAVATDLETGREIWLRSGPVAEAVRASIALPGVLSPVRVDGRWLGDGGMVNPVPVSACRALGARLVIAVNLNTDLVRPFRERPARGAPPRNGVAGASAEFVRRLVDQMPRPLREASGVIPRLLRPRLGAPGYFDVLINALNIMEGQITRARLAAEPPEVLISPRVAAIRPFEFNRAGEAIALGRAAATRALPEIRRMIAESAL